MKIRGSEKTGGFYEAFSDIIFATMAIFILLMVIFLVLANASNPIRRAEKKLEGIEQAIVESQERTQKALAAAQPIKKQVADLAEKKVEIAIIVDKSGTMEAEIYNLKHAINRLAEILPKIMDEVRMSVVTYRIDRQGRNQSELFPMRDLRQREDDGGRSQAALRNFLARQRHADGTAPILAATKQAIGQFSPAGSYRGHQVLMILGDVGPYETNYQNANVYTAEGQRRAEEMVRVVSGWAKARKHRNLILMFSGRDEMNSWLVGSSDASRDKHRRSMELFKTIARESGQKDAYTENQASMFVDFLVAALKRK